jgi:lactobin A/cerein 7B family class IIb bacteriocin
MERFEDIDLHELSFQDMEDIEGGMIPLIAIGFAAFMAGAKLGEMVGKLAK